MDSAVPGNTPLHIDLHFARARQAGDPYAFQFEPQEYVLIGIDGRVTNAELPWDQGLLADITTLRWPGNDSGILQRVGERLRKFLAALCWQEQEAAIARAALTGQPVIITIRSAAAELYALPWELTTLKSTGQHIGGLARVVIRYEWPGSKTATGITTPVEQRVLVAWSAASGAVPAREHIGAISSACVEGRLRFDTQANVLNHVSLQQLFDALESAEEQGAPITILHLLCHGSSVGNSFGLALEDTESDGSPIVVDGRRLEQVLQPFVNHLRLIVLSACDGSNPGVLGNQLGSVAQCLHRSGFPAVLASRYPLSTTGSVQFTQAFYQALLGKGASVEPAFMQARRRLITNAANHDWASLQLYARSGYGEEHRSVVERPFQGSLPTLPAVLAAPSSLVQGLLRAQAVLPGATSQISAVEPTENLGPPPSDVLRRSPSLSRPATQSSSSAGPPQQPSPVPLGPSATRGKHLAARLTPAPQSLPIDQGGLGRSYAIPITALSADWIISLSRLRQDPVLATHLPKISRDLAINLVDLELRVSQSPDAHLSIDDLCPLREQYDRRRGGWRFFAALLARRLPRMVLRHETCAGDIHVPKGTNRVVLGNLQVKGNLHVGGALTVLGDLYVEGYHHDSATELAQIIVAGDVHCHEGLVSEGFLGIGGKLDAPYVHLSSSQGCAKILGGCAAHLFVESDHRGTRVFGPLRVEAFVGDEVDVDDETALPVSELADILALVPAPLEKELRGLDEHAIGEVLSERLVRTGRCPLKLG